MRIAVSLVVLVGLFFAVRFFARQGQESAERGLLAHAIAQYGIAAKHGSAVDRCAQAGFVKAAALQAQDEGAFAAWTKTEADACAAAVTSP